MIRSCKWFLGAALFFLVTALTSCTDKNAVLDQNAEITNRNWSYLNKIRYDVKIDDISAAYNIYVNLRVTSDYKYSNMFILFSMGAKNARPDVKRHEITLASKDGEWLGKGTGNLYSYQYPLLTNYKFPAPGVYHFEIEQNMRDNPLREVSDVGLRVEKAEGE